MKKIAIQGHPTRGKEIIKIFENLGGINKYSISGTCSTNFYYINKNNYIKDAFGKSLCNYKLYTLEEFEKEFPFKIGDKVIYSHAPYIGTIVDIKFDDNIPYRVNIMETICTCGTKMLKSYNSMNTRNITLTLDKAKEWYKQGGDLKEVALQAFTEQELNPLPKSWEEYCKGYKVPAMIFGPCIPNKYVALWKLEQLRDCYRQGWAPDYRSLEDKYCLVGLKDIINLAIFRYNKAFLSFQSKEVAEEFLKNFEPLIKEAGDLLQ